MDMQDSHASCLGVALHPCKLTRVVGEVGRWGKDGLAWQADDTSQWVGCSEPLVSPRHDHQLVRGVGGGARG